MSCVSPTCMSVCSMPHPQQAHIDHPKQFAEGLCDGVCARTSPTQQQEVLAMLLALHHLLALSPGTHSDTDSFVNDCVLTYFMFLLLVLRLLDPNHTQGVVVVCRARFGDIDSCGAASVTRPVCLCRKCCFCERRRLNCTCIFLVMLFLFCVALMLLFPCVMHCICISLAVFVLIRLSLQLTGGSA